MAEPNRDPDGSTAATPPAPARAARGAESEGTPARTQDADARVAGYEAAASDPARPDVEPLRGAAADTAREQRTGTTPVATSTTPVAPSRDTASRETVTTPIAPAPAEQPVLQPADQDHPQAPKKGGNRLVGTAWVLLAAGLFEVLFFAVLALITLLLAGAGVVGPQLAVYAQTPLAWFPVLIFFLLFELVVLLFNRAGRFLYVVASLIVGVLVYFLSVLVIAVVAGGGLGDRNTLTQIFLTPPLLVTGVVAREVMLWTGFAIGARGKRVRRRNRVARDTYRQELAERDDARA